MTPSIAIVIPTYGAFEYAEKAILSAYRGTNVLRPTVILVDDASPNWDHAWPKKFSHVAPDMHVHRFPANGGLTRSWNYGLATALEAGFDFACVTNSDVVFSAGWDMEIFKALNSGYDLVGPVTNAPGTGFDQYVARYSAIYRPSTAEDEIDRVQLELRGAQYGRFKAATLNGFCMVAKTTTWADHAYAADRAFRPRNDFNSKGEKNPTPLMTLNEDELQARWRAAGLKTGVALGSYVFHYRAVTRGDKHKRGDWVRLPEKSG